MIAYYRQQNFFVNLKVIKRIKSILLEKNQLSTKEDCKKDGKGGGRREENKNLQ